MLGSGNSDFFRALKRDDHFRTTTLPRSEPGIWEMIARTKQGADRRPAVMVQPADRSIYCPSGVRWRLVEAECDGALIADFSDAGHVALNGELIAVRLIRNRLTVIERPGMVT